MVHRQLVRSRVPPGAAPFSRTVRPRRRAQIAVEPGLREPGRNEATPASVVTGDEPASTIDTDIDPRRATEVNGGRDE
jgi:hypothetical protein